MSSPASADAAGVPSSRLRRAYVEACRAELRALKPGNVHVHAAGAGMTVADFELSAEVSADALCAPGRSVGARIRDAVEATRAAVGTNTNLGIVLLAAPLVAAAEGAAPGALRRALGGTLDRLTIADAEAAFAAIRLARPAGLGRAPAEDVAAPPTVDLKQAMMLAADRDRIARQYATTYGDVFARGVRRLAAARRAGAAGDWATSLAYMGFLAAFPDSHIVRKWGAAKAEAVRAEASALARRLPRAGPSGALVQELLAFDRRLKADGLNPGTSADLTVASLLALAADDMLRELGATNTTSTGSSNQSER